MVADLRVGPSDLLRFNCFMNRFWSLIVDICHFWVWIFGFDIRCLLFTLRWTETLICVHFDDFHEILFDSHQLGFFVLLFDWLWGMISVVPVGLALDIKDLHITIIYHLRFKMSWTAYWLKLFFSFLEECFDNFVFSILIVIFIVVVVFRMVSIFFTSCS